MFNIGDRVRLTKRLYFDDGAVALEPGIVGTVEDVFEDGMLQVRFPDGTPHDAVHWCDPDELERGMLVYVVETIDSPSDRFLEGAFSTLERACASQGLTVEDMEAHGERNWYWNSLHPKNKGRAPTSDVSIEAFVVDGE